ncbi:hypothetical protein ACL9RF_13825 [Sphingobacterium sp. Mn56C]|uniref:hypothetical protein n=1 Tax=Sphingobacterium sp. Mn56C TaxID=3395261 RepID=UPI003BDD9485
MKYNIQEIILFLYNVSKRWLGGVRLLPEHLGKVGLMGAVAGGMLQGGSNLLRGRNFWTGV